MTQILELTDNGFKTAIIINMFKDLKDALMNERMGNLIKKQKLWKKKNGNVEFKSSVSDMKSSNWRQQKK